MKHEQLFRNSPESVRQARRWVVRTLQEVPPERADDIAVMVSELATNSVRHAATDFVVDIRQTDDDIRIEVTDSGAGEPVVRSPEPNDITGRGLRIVADLCDTWGVRISPGQGKTVWFTIRVGPVPT